MTILQQLLQRNTLTILGVNSGTSIDGLDLSLVRVRRSRSSHASPLLVTELRRRAVSFPDGLRQELLELATDKKIHPERLALVDEAFGEFIGRECQRLIKSCATQGLKVDCIASHGQTVRHHPNRETIAGFPVRATLQVGSPERIATISERVVVSHFRQSDTALDGEGAPITTTAVSHCLRDRKESRLVVNIGGIANYFYMPARKGSVRTLAEDIGPGNLLLDQITRILFDKPFDNRGELARLGTVDLRLLKALMGKRFFGLDSSQRHSTGREQYGETAVRKILKRAKALSVNNYSVLATVTELVASRIALRLEPMLSADRLLKGIYLTGGGAKNTFLVKRLRAHIVCDNAHCHVHSIKRLGVHPDSFEATCYATLGWLCLHGIPAEAVTGNAYAKQPMIRRPILGRIIQPPKR